MFQRMRQPLSIDAHGVDLDNVTDIEVYLEQRSTNVRLKFTGEDVIVVDNDTLTLMVQKEDMMRMSKGTIRAQIAFTAADGVPDASKIFYVPVDEFIWRDGYGD